MVEGKNIIEYDEELGKIIREIWNRVEKKLGERQKEKT